MKFNPSQVQGIDFSDIDPERLNKILKKIQRISDEEVTLLVSKMHKIIRASNQRKALVENIELFLRIAALVGSAL